MSLMNLTMKHGRDLAGARANLEQAVGDLRGRFGPLVRRVDWDADRTKVRIEGVGFWVEIRVDATEVHGSGDIPALGGLLGGPLGGGLKQLIERTFKPGLPGRPAP